MGRASRAKRERREAPAPEVPHFEVHAGLASATGGAGSEQETKENS